MAKHEIAPEELTASHIGQYVKVSTEYPIAGTKRETLLIATLAGIEHRLEERGKTALQTRITLEVAADEVTLHIPFHLPIDVADTMDELLDAA